MKGSTLLLTALGTALAVSAQAATPAFSENFDGRRFPRNEVPTSFPAQLGDALVFAPAGASIQADPSCDPLSTDIMVVESTIAAGGFEVRFVHQDGPTGQALAEQEVMALKLGQARTDLWGAQPGFTSVDGFQVLPLQLGPALDTDTDKSLGRIYLFGEPTDLRYGSIFDSVCDGFVRTNNQVNVDFRLYGTSMVYYVGVQVFGPVPMAQRFGPFPLPAQFENGYGACMVLGQAGCGRVAIDGVECVGAAVQELDPLQDGNSTHRETGRRSR